MNFDSDLLISIISFIIGIYILLYNTLFSSPKKENSKSNTKKDKKTSDESLIYYRKRKNRKREKTNISGLIDNFVEPKINRIKKKK